MNTPYLAPQMAMPFGAGANTAQFWPDETPVYQQVLTWALLIPLLYLVVDGQFSIANPYNSALMTENGYLLRTAQGIRPQVVLYYLLMAVFIVSGYREIWRVILNNKVLLLAPLFAAFSATWSESPLMTFRASFELMMTTLFAFYLTERFSTDRLMKLLMFVGTVAGLLSVILAVFLPNYGIYHRGGGAEWQGICSHKNALGVSMAFLLTPVFYLAQRPILKLGYAALLLFLIGMCQSRGAWFVTLGVLLFTAWLSISRRLGNKQSLLWAVATGAAVIGMVFLALLYLEPLLKTIGKDPTLTGRTGIYLAVLDSIFKHPFLGYGFGAFWLGLNRESLIVALRIHWMTIGYAENGLLELWLELGAVGLLLVLFLFWRAIRQSVRLIRSRYYSPRVGWFSAILFLQLITNVEAGMVMTPVTINWTLTLIAFVGLAKEWRIRPRSESVFVALGVKRVPS
jgi:exopolysaccharide production protein ExoQ